MNKKYESKILLVDDDSKNLQVAMSILKDYNVIYAQSGEKAMELLEKNAFDLILLDIVMPTLNGYDVCTMIKNDEKNKKIPLIFLTVKDDEKDIVKGFELGAVDYITKPFYSEVLLKRVEVHLKLATAMNEIEKINSNLSEIVKDQLKELRQKDEIIVQEAKISAIASVVNIMSVQWRKPLDKIKLYLQSLDFKFLNLEEFKDDDTFRKTLIQVNTLDETMLDFHKFFNNHKKKEIVNLKVALDNSIFPLKGKIEDLNVNINILGDNLLSLNIVSDEIKHVFSKLIDISLENFRNNISHIDKFIKISFDNVKDSVFITYDDNSKNYEDREIENLFNVDKSIEQEKFDLGFYLVKIFIEKNSGLLMVKKTDDGIKYIIRFDK